MFIDGDDRLMTAGWFFLETGLVLLQRQSRSVALTQALNPA